MKCNAGVVAAMVALGVLVLAPPSSADTIAIGASADNTILQSNPTNSLGGAQAMLAGTNAAPSPRRGLMMFDIASAVPAGSTITGVQLTLYLSQVAGGGGPQAIDLIRLSNTWGEGTAGSHTTGTSGIGQGFPAGNGDATWNARHFSATTPTLWNTSGGDFAASASASQTIAGTTLNLPYTWFSTAALVADVQGWLDAPATNFGWMLKNQDEVSIQTARAFWTREAARTGQSVFAPQLQITYTPVPEPSAIAIALVALTSGARRFRQ